MRQRDKRKAGAPGQRRRKTDFRQAAEDKGWRMSEIAERWGITPLSLSRQTREPDQKTLDALGGLPCIRGKDDRDEQEN